MGIIGFIGAGTGYTANDLSVINFELINKIFPSWVAIPFLAMIISGLLSTIDSNLCAVSSLTTDIVKDMRKSKIAMIGLLILGIVIANIPELTVTHLFLLYGTLRASTVLPTILTLKGRKLNARGVSCGIICSLVIGLPIFAYGNIYNLPLYKTVGSLLTVTMSAVVAVIITKIERCHNE